MTTKIPVRAIQKNSENPPFSENFSIRRVADLLNGSEMTQHLHRHDFFYLLVLKEGSGVHEIDFNEYEIKNNCVFLMRPGQVHRLRLGAESSGYLVEFKPDFYFQMNDVLTQAFKQVHAVNYILTDEAKLQKLLSVLNYVYTEQLGADIAHQEIMRANLGIFYLELFRLHHPALPSGAEMHHRQILENFLQLVENNIGNEKKTAWYASRLHISNYQLNAITKKFLGKPASEVLNEYVILEARRLLLATSNQVNQVAYLLGYQDVSYFVRFFKKQTGHSPEAFRKNHR